MTKAEAKATIAEIAEDVLRSRGDMSTDRLKTWAKGYTHWAAACDPLTTEEIDDAIFDGRSTITDELADIHEEGRYEELGEAAYGRED